MHRPPDAGTDGGGDVSGWRLSLGVCPSKGNLSWRARVGDERF